jgi:hypothetical protein
VADRTSASIEIAASPATSIDGGYELEPKGAQTTVTYHLAVEVNLPMIGMFQRTAEQTIIDGALTNLKKRVES